MSKDLILTHAAACFACGDISCDWDCKETYIKRLAAAQAEIAELNRLSDKQSEQYHALRTKHDQLQSALDIAKEALKEVANMHPCGNPSPKIKEAISALKTIAEMEQWK